MLLSIEEMKLLVALINQTPLQGTLHTLPPILSKLLSIRKRLDDTIRSIENKQHEEPISSDKP